MTYTAALALRLRCNDFEARGRYIATETGATSHADNSHIGNTARNTQAACDAPSVCHRPEVIIVGEVVQRLGGVGVGGQ